MKIPSNSFNFQKGFLLLEGLIAILIFSLGILAVVGMQANAIGHSNQAKYRNDASFAANILIGQMWVDSDNEMTKYKTGDTKFKKWFDAELKDTLPKDRSSATVDVTELPATVTFTGTGLPIPARSFNVAIRIQWRAANENDALPAHVYQVVTQIVRNP
jgi:type IV pilus assembly protein PilV